MEGGGAKCFVLLEAIGSFTGPIFISVREGGGGGGGRRSVLSCL
jgi:hypothetical protein